MTQVDTFFELHMGPELLVVGNAWDAGSAIAFEKNGYKAVATSSAALANAMGYEDGEHLPFESLLGAVRRIIDCINIPLSVDLERGYSENIQGIIQNVDRLYDAGAVGINIEDSVRVGERALQPVDVFTKKLEGLADHFARKNSKFFINARTDAYLTGLSSPLRETLIRAKAYENAGASGIFVPFATASEDIKKIVEATSLPVHVLYHQQLPPFKELGKLGVKRVSMGSAIYRVVMAVMENHIRSIHGKQAYQPLN
ncbi:MAG TPA: isocitrate lyase/phosphoenolpyruvate mutase family protein [Chitinophagaceae bacterium]